MTNSVFPGALDNLGAGYVRTEPSLASVLNAIESSVVRVLHPSGDTSGATDVTNMTALQGLTFTVAPGLFYLDAMVTFTGSESLIGSGSAWSLPDATATVFQCVNAGAGITFSAGSGGIASGFTVDGHGVATTPFVRSGVGGYRLFNDIAVVGSAANNVTILAAQNDVWVKLTTTGAVHDGLYMDTGAAGHTFDQFEAFNCGRYQFHADSLVSGSVNDIAFNDGIFDAAGAAGVSAIYLRHASNIRFNGPQGFPACSGPSVDCDATNSFIHFNGIFGEGVTTGTVNTNVYGVIATGAPGHALYQLAGGPYYFDGCAFSGDTSLYFTAGTVVHLTNSADSSVNGWLSHSGVASPETFVTGTPGPWRQPTAFLNSWASVGAPSAAVSFRSGPNGELQFVGEIAGGVTGDAAFAVPTAFWPGSTFRAAAVFGGVVSIQLSVGVWYLYVTGAGNVYLDGVSFPLDI